MHIDALRVALYLEKHIYREHGEFSSYEVDGSSPNGGSPVSCHGALVGVEI